MTTLYDASVGTFRQILGASEKVLAKGRSHLTANGVGLDEMIETRLIEDMLPFTFQVVSVAHHSLGALKGVEAGVFEPPKPPPGVDYDGLCELVAQARSGVEAFSEEQVNGFEDKSLEFRIGGNAMPFVGGPFLLSFSLPNFYFHATTMYDLLRMKGVPLGKRDFLALGG